MIRKLAMLAIVLAPAVTFAQSYPFELTGAVGYASGGEIRVNDTQLTDGFEAVDVERGGILSVRLDWQLNDRWQLEGLIAEQRSQLEDSQRLFGEQPAGPLRPGDVNSLDVWTTYYHFGALYAWEPWREPYEIQPYVVGSAGITHISFSDVPLDSADDPSLSLGTGLKLAITNRFGMRFEARTYYTFTDSGEQTTVPIVNRDCLDERPVNPCKRTYAYDSSYMQIEASVGFTYKF